LKDIKKGDELLKKIEKQALDIDSIMSGQTSNNLNYWLKSAWDYGNSDAESKLYLKNAKTLITLWGGEGHLNDYASRAWRGMYKDFYWPRWKMFLEAQRKSAANNTSFNEEKVRESIKQLEV
jgi:alpha-N-acetylglucosaminidase